MRLGCGTSLALSFREMTRQDAGRLYSQVLETVHEFGSCAQQDYMDAIPMSQVSA